MKKFKFSEKGLKYIIAPASILGSTVILIVSYSYFYKIGTK